MAGISRQQLKSIVKECLVEILAEGMGSTTASSINEVSNRANRQSASHQSSILRQNASKTTLTTARQSTTALKEAIRRESGGNSVMADILRDTATNTLPSMLENDKSRVSPVSAGLTERLVASHAPEELFGEEAASKWADLAFAAGPKK